MLNIQCCCMGFPNVEHRSDVVAWDFLMFNIDLMLLDGIS